MFSRSLSLGHVLLYQNQPPSLVDPQTSYLQRHKKHNPKTIVSLSTSKDLPVQSQCDDVLPRPMSSRRAGRLLQSCSGLEDVRKTHALVIKFVTDPDPFVDNNLISVYVKFGNLAAARLVFDNMPERTTVSWTAMLDGYRKHRMPHEALNLFIDLLESGSHGNAHTYVCLFNLCGRIPDRRLGRQMHARVVKARFSNFILDCTILHFYAKCGELPAAFCVFDRMPDRDLITWTTMITACSQHGRGWESLELLSQMMSRGVCPNEFTICSALNACGEERELKLGQQLHGTALKKAYGSDVYVGTALIDLYAKCGEVEDARRLFDGMKIRNGVTWNSIIAGYTRNGLGEEAIALSRTMTRLRVPANDLTMVSLLRACGLVGSLHAGKEVHARVLKNSSKQENVFVGSALVWLYCKCGAYAYASRVSDSLSDKDVVSWTTMISGCVQLGHEHEALEYLKEMMGRGVEPNQFTYSSALKACAKLGDVSQGRLIHSSLDNTPASSNVFVGSALVHMYSRCGHLPEAARVFDRMPERNRVSWKSMVVAYARRGLCGEALGLVYRMRAEGIEVDDYVLSTVLTAGGDFRWEGGSPEKDVLLRI